MANIVGYTRGGEVWVPKFIESIDIHKCIGCGRCYKACSREVLELIEKPFKGEDEYGDDMGNKVMSVANPRELHRMRGMSRGHARRSVMCI